MPHFIKREIDVNKMGAWLFGFHFVYSEGREEKMQKNNMVKIMNAYYKVAKIAFLALSITAFTFIHIQNCEAKEDEAITYIRIDRNYECHIGKIQPGEMELLPKNKHYQMYIDPQYAPKDIQLGMSIPAKLTLTANNGYSFKGLKIGSCLSDYGKINTLKISSDKKTAWLDFTADPLPMQLSAPKNLKWNNMTATWTKATYAASYELKIYVINDKGTINTPKKTITTQETSIDCSSILLSMPGDYIFSVAAIPDKKKAYLKVSDKATLDYDTSCLVSSDMIGLHSGYWRSNKGAQQYINKSVPLKSGLYKINGYYYNFDNDGYIRIGWNQINTKWHYFDNSGKMMFDWLNDGGAKYYLQEDGSMATGWLAINDKWYHFSSTGKMDTGWINYKGDIYFLNSDGSMRTKKMIDKNGTVYNFRENGALIR